MSPHRKLSKQDLLSNEKLKAYVTRNDLWASESRPNILLSSSNLMHNDWNTSDTISRFAEEQISSPLGTPVNRGEIISFVDAPSLGWHLLRQDTQVAPGTVCTVSIFVKSVKNAGTKDFTIWTHNGVQLAVFERDSWRFISGKAQKTKVETLSDGWVRVIATYIVEQPHIYFGSSDGATSQYMGENKKQFYLTGPQLELSEDASPYIATKDFKTDLFPPRFDATYLVRTLGDCQKKYPLKRAVILHDNYVDIYPLKGIDCSKESVDVINQFDFLNTVFIFACDSDDIGLPFIERIVANKGTFLPVFSGIPALYVNFNAHARRLIEDEQREQISDGFLKMDAGPHDFINIIQAIDITKNLKGDFVEIGCFNGSSSRMAIRYMFEKKIERNCYLLDVFDGFNYQAAQKSADAIWCGTHQTPGPETVSKRMSKYTDAPAGMSVSVIRNNIIEDNLPKQIRKIAVANIDVDLYDAVKVALFKVCDKIVSGGIMIVEDPGHTPLLIGARLAISEFMQSEKSKMFTPVYLQSGQTYLIRK